MDKIKLSVGIPAYNEQDNIANLISSVMLQEQDNFDLLEIIVVSDASTDNTSLMVKSLPDPRITLIENEDRVGQSISQNKVIESFKGDILVLLNADILIRDTAFLSKMTAPFLKDPKLGIVAARVTPLPALNFFESVINASANLKQEIYEQINSQNTLYLCHGRARAFSRSFASQLRFPAAPGEDAYSYIQCIKGGFGFLYCSDAQILYRSPQNMLDHFRQSKRFIKAKNRLDKKYRNENKSYYEIPFGLLIRVSWKHFLAHPVLLGSYAFVYGWARISALWFHASTIWEISVSSKSALRKIE